MGIELRWTALYLALGMLGQQQLAHWLHPSDVEIQSIGFAGGAFPINSRRSRNIDVRAPMRALHDDPHAKSYPRAVLRCDFAGGDENVEGQRLIMSFHCL